MKVLVVTDMQNDFVTGVFGNNESKAIVDPIIDYIKSFDGKVVFTQDTHHGRKDADDRHSYCIENTYGWKFVDGIQELVDDNDYTVFRKKHYASPDLADYLRIWDKYGDLESVTLVGVFTDECILANAFLIKALVSDVPVLIKKDLVAATTPDLQNSILELLDLANIVEVI